MNGNVEDLLREGLDRLTADAGVPAGMAHKARAHRRRRKIVIRTALACGTAVAVAAAVIIGAGPLKVYATLYVSPSTYLPVRVIWSNWTHWRNGKPMHGIVREDIRALPPTPGNIAKATITIPKGLRRVPANTAPFGGPMTQFFG